MATSPVGLFGRRSWAAFAAFTLALGAVIGTQTHARVAHADLSPVANTTSLSPSVAASPTAEASPAVAAPATPAPDAPAVTTQEPAKPAKAAKPAKTAPHAGGQDVCSGPDW